MTFKDSATAHKYLDHLRGLEIGAGAHNPFNLPNCLNVDYTGSMETDFKKAEIRNCGSAAPVHIVSQGDSMPFLNNESFDYIISSHVIEHFFDPMKAVKEWLRILRPGGYIFIICPHVNRVPDEHRPVNTLEELILRHTGKIQPQDINMEGGHPDHKTVWSLESMIDCFRWLDLNIVETQDPDDKVGNGFTVILQK